jgi:UDP-N-acetylmuramoylalanine--D-glutamate ligase
VLSPGVPPDQPAIQAARDRGVPVIAEIELASRWLKGRVIAITGTKGKSTTTALTGRMLEAAGFKVTVGGNIGAPLSAQVADSTPESFHVVETSSFQLEQIDTFHPWIAVMLNFSPDHLDRHPSVEAYAAAKARIFEKQNATDWAVVNADDPGVLAMARRGRAQLRLFSPRMPLEDGTAVEQGWIVDRRLDRAERLVPLSAIHLLGPHLVNDVMAAATVGALAGAAPAGVDAAGGWVSLLREPLTQRAKAVVAIGEARPLVRDALAGAIPVYEADLFSEAVTRAFALAQPSGVVLLAPACASFDMFRDYADRGRQFKDEVRKLKADG